MFSFNLYASIVPNGGNDGSYWQTESTREIAWDSVYFDSNIDIDLWDRFQAKYISIATNVDYDLESYSWAIPDSLSFGENRFRIRVREMNDTSNYFMSQSYFTILASESSSKQPNINYEETKPATQEISQNLSTMKLFPIPTNNQINIEFMASKSANCDLKIFDNSGQLIEHVSNIKLNEGKNLLIHDLSKYLNGSYSILIESEDRVVMNRIVVVH